MHSLLVLCWSFSLCNILARICRLYSTTVFCFLDRKQFKIKETPIIFTVMSSLRVDYIHQSSMAFSIIPSTKKNCVSARLHLLFIKHFLIERYYSMSTKLVFKRFIIERPDVLLKGYFLHFTFQRSWGNINSGFIERRFGVR